MNRTSLSSRHALLAAALGALGASGASADYSFKVDGNGTAIKIWWTDDKGNRIGDPLYDGTLQTGETVSRSTKSPSVYDHSLKETSAFTIGFGDVHWGISPLSGAPVQQDVEMPALMDLDPAGGRVHVFYIVDAEAYSANGGQYQEGRKYLNWSAGRSPELPGYLVGWSTNANMTIEQAFSFDPVTGQAHFLGAQPYTSAMGPLTATLRVTALKPRCPADFNGDGFVNGEDFDEFVAEFESGCE